MKQDPRLRSVWEQRAVPVVFRGESGPLIVRLPFSADNYVWLRNGNRNKPKWNSKLICWEIPLAWFEDVIRRAVDRYDQAYVIQLHREQQKCAPACWNAGGLHCECSCLGANHGGGHPGGNWYEVSETFACEWGPKQYACRLISKT